MRKLVAIEFLTLDGVIQGPGSPDEDREGGFEHGGWSAPYFDEVQGAAAAEGMAATDTYLFGRKTYEKMVQFWPHQPDDDPMAAHLNSTKKFVASRTLREPTWNNTTVIDGDIADEVKKLKESDGGTVAVLGSGELLQTLMDNNLVDEYRLFLHPIVLGSGKRLFRSYPQPRGLRLVDSKPTTTGVLLLAYEPA